VPCLLDDDGNLYNEGLSEKLAKEREDWKPET
jgi:hypothetical protein